MTKLELVNMLEKMGVIITDSHIVYKAGDHGEAYVNKDTLYIDPRKTSLVCAEIASRIFRRCHNLKIDSVAVVAPAVGGVALSQWTAFHLKDLGVNALALYADKSSDGGFELRRGYDGEVKGRWVAVVEDVLTTGSSALATVHAVQRSGGTVIMVAGLCNRGGVTAEALGVPHLECLLDVNLARYSAETCPMCARGMPINTSVGHGKEFLERQRVTVVH